MEYRAQASSSYSDCSASSTSVASGTYCVRYKSTATLSASPDAVVTVPAYSED